MANKGLQQLGVEGKLESWFCTLKFSYKSIHLANQTPTASSPRRYKQVMETAYFENIRFELISALKRSTNEIRIAVAWFTNQELFDVLIDRLANNVDITLVIIDDYINNGSFGLDFELFLNNGGKLYYGIEENPMHHKFCVIDDSILFTGSYNWTYYAENKNKENIVKFENNKPIIEVYRNQFNLLISQLDRIQVANKISIEQFESKNLFSIKNYVALDLLHKGKETFKNDLVEKSKEIAPDNSLLAYEYNSFQAIALVEMTTKKPSPFQQPQFKNEISKKNNTTKISIGIKGIINGNQNRLAIIVPKGTIIPCELARTFCTAEDNQSQMTIETYKGENIIADKNIALGKIIIKDLPKREAGKTSITVTIKIVSNNNLVVIAKSNDTGNQMEAVYYDKTIID